MSLKSSKAECIRDKIVSTADDLFYRQGFNYTSFADISKAVGISRGNFYYHFKTKDDILAAVLESRKTNISKMLTQWNERYTDVKLRMIAFVSMIASSQDNIIEHGCPLGSTCTELTKLNNINSDNAAEIIALIRVWLRAQIKELGYDNNQADQQAMHLLTRTQGVSVIGQTFKDCEYINREVEEMKVWVNAL